MVLGQMLLGARGVRGGSLHLGLSSLLGSWPHVAGEPWPRARGYGGRDGVVEAWWVWAESLPHAELSLCSPSEGSVIPAS